jgi:hypothetical protein
LAALREVTLCTLALATTAVRATHTHTHARTHTRTHTQPHNHTATLSSFGDAVIRFIGSAINKGYVKKPRLISKWEGLR